MAEGERETKRQEIVAVREMVESSDGIERLAKQNLAYTYYSGRRGREGWTDMYYSERAHLRRSHGDEILPQFRITERR